MVLMVVGVLLLATIILSIVVSSKSATVEKLKADSTKQSLVEKSLRDFVGSVSSERDLAEQRAKQSEKQSTDWQLKYLKCKRNDYDCNCEEEVSRNNVVNAPDVEQGSILYINASRYAPASTNRLNNSEAARSRVVVQ